MKVLFFDIETYKDFFCFVGINTDFDTDEIIKETHVRSSNSGEVNADCVRAIEQAFDEADYIVSFNGSKFDLPILAKMKRDVERLGSTNSQYIHYDGNLIIENTNDGRPQNFYRVQAWNAKHFDLLNNCLLKYSLKQWEMYCDLPIEELPYKPDETLTDDMKDRIERYCRHDVWATWQIFNRYGSGKVKTSKNTLRTQIEIMKMMPEGVTYKLDRTAQSTAASIVYGVNSSIPPKTSNPLELFDVEMFDVPAEVKTIIRKIANGDITAEATKLAYEYHEQNGIPLRKGKPLIRVVTMFDEKLRTYPIDSDGTGIRYGKGGCHYIKKGEHRNVKCKDVQSEYPRTIRKFELLKTQYALDTWSGMMEARFAMKAKKGTPDYRPDEDNGRKLVLNSLSGGFRMSGGYSVAYDPAAGEAMCYLGQLIITEMALSVPKEDLIEVNTDSIFYVGDHDSDTDAKAKQMLEKYDMLFENETMQHVYFRDVNNYIVYKEDGSVDYGKGDDFADYGYKGNERAVSDELFRHLILPKLDLKWESHDWKDYVYKYHKAGSAVYASIGGEPMTHKNYYFLWTTGDCPDAKCIEFTNDRFSHDGDIKARYGVYAFSVEALERYKEYIDYNQYKRDLDVAFALWNRPDLITTRFSKEQMRAANKKNKETKEPMMTVGMLARYV